MSPPDRPYQRRLLRNSATTAATGGWAVLVAAVTVPVLLGNLGIEQFGLWALVWSFSAVNGWPSVATVGFATAWVRRVSAAEVAGQPARAAGTLTAFALVGAVVGVAMASAGGPLLSALTDTDADGRTALTGAARWAGLWIAAEAVLMGASALLEGRQLVDRSRLLDAARRTATAVASMVAAIGGASVVGVMAAAAVTATAVAGVVVVVLVRTQAAFRPIGRPDHLLALGDDAGRLTALNASGVLHRSMDRLLVAALVGPAGVAAVEVASRLRDIAQLVLSTTSYTTISAAGWLDAQGEHQKLHQLVVVGTRLTLLATWTTVAVLAVFATPLLDVWLGDDAPADIVTLARLGLAYTLVMAPFQVAVNGLTGLGRVGGVIRAAWIGVVVNLVASIVLTARLGVEGAFLGTLVGSLVVVPLLWRPVRPLLGRRTGPALAGAVAAVVPPVVLVALGGLVVIGAGWSPGPTLAVGAVVTACLAVPAALRWSIDPADFGGRAASIPAAAGSVSRS